MNELNSLISGPTLQGYVAVRSLAVTAIERLRTEERGEGVISAAIAVLIMAFLGAAMWLAFKGIFDGASKQTGDQVNQIGK